MSFDLSHFLHDLTTNILNDLQCVIDCHYAIPQSRMMIMNRMNYNIEQHYYSYTVLFIIINAILSFIEVINFLPLLTFISVLLAYLVIIDIDSSILRKARLDPQFVHGVAVVFYFFVSFLCDIVIFSFIVLFIPLALILTLSIFQIYIEMKEPTSPLTE